MPTFSTTLDLTAAEWNQDISLAVEVNLEMTDPGEPERRPNLNDPGEPAEQATFEVASVLVRYSDGKGCFIVAPEIFTSLYPGAKDILNAALDWVYENRFEFGANA